MNELLGLQTSISNVKVEHEEHRSGIAKLAAMKKRLQDEIAKHQSVLQKYQQLNEKLKFEHTLAQNIKVHDAENGSDLVSVKSNKDKHPGGNQFLKI